MAYTADVNRWRGPVEEPYRPHMLDSPWHPGWIAVTILGFIIWWPIGLALLFFTLGSRKMALLEPPGSLAEQDGADAVRRWSGCATTWSGAASASAASARPRAATAPSTNTAWKPAAARGRADRIPGFPRSPASRQGQGRVRPVHGAAPPAPDAAERPAAAELNCEQYRDYEQSKPQA